MKKFIKTSLIMMVLSAQMAPAFAGRNNYKPAHGGYPGVVPPTRTEVLRRQVFNGNGPHIDIAQFLDRRSQTRLAQVEQISRTAVSEVRRIRETRNPEEAVERVHVDAENTRLRETSIRAVNKFEVLEDRRVSPEFAQLGHMHKVAGLIWSGVAPRIMDQRDAVAYCASLGGGARLPTKEEYIALGRAMGARRSERLFDNLGNVIANWDTADYNPNLISAMDNRLFWSASVRPYSVRPYNEAKAVYFNGGAGIVGGSNRDYVESVRCVVDGL